MFHVKHRDEKKHQGKTGAVVSVLRTDGGGKSPPLRPNTWITRERVTHPRPTPLCKQNCLFFLAALAAGLHKQPEPAALPTVKRVPRTSGRRTSAPGAPSHQKKHPGRQSGPGCQTRNSAHKKRLGRHLLGRTSYFTTQKNLFRFQQISL